MTISSLSAEEKLMYAEVTAVITKLMQDERAELQRRRDANNLTVEEFEGKRPPATCCTAVAA
jgi:hypothetical protein